MKIKTIFALALLVSSCRQAPDQLLHKAYIFSQQKKYIEAVGAYTEAIYKDNKLQLAYYNRGQCYYDIKDYTKALADFNTILALKKSNNSLPQSSRDTLSDVSPDEALYQWAQVYFYLDSIQNAFKDFQTLVKNNFAEKCTCLLWEGVIWLKAGENEQACQYFKNAQQIAVSSSEKQQAENMIAAYCTPPAAITLIDSSKTDSTKIN